MHMTFGNLTLLLLWEQKLMASGSLIPADSSRRLKDPSYLGSIYWLMDLSLIRQEAWSLLILHESERREKKKSGSQTYILDQAEKGYSKTLLLLSPFYAF